MFHLFGNKISIFCFFLLLCSLSASAQRGKNYNYLDYQAKPYFFGITLAYNNLGFNILRSKKFAANDSIYRIDAFSATGFNLGVVTNLKLGEYFDLRFLPTLSFGERNLRYFAPRETVNYTERKVESVFVELPFHVRYKSAPYNDMRAFVITGVKYSFDVASDSRSRQSKNIVKISPTDFSVEVGAGIQFFFPYFIFSPEIKFSQGLSNSLIFDNKLEQSSVIEKLYSRGFTLSLHFEG